MAVAEDYGSTGLHRRESKLAYSKEDFPRDSRSSEPADDLLEALGYTQQLARSRSTLSVTFMSFVLASVPYGLSTTLIYPLTGGGPSCIIWGWVAVCLFMICVAASLGEITSVCCTEFAYAYCAFLRGEALRREMSVAVTSSTRSSPSQFR